MKNNIKFGNNDYDLTGRTLRIKDYAPKYNIITNDLELITSEKFTGKTKIIHSFPSLDTVTCNKQIQDFDSAPNISKNVIILGISMDLPFAQKRYAETNKLVNSILLSDYQYSSFGLNYGVLIIDIKLLNRSVFVIDRNDIIKYFEIATDVSHKLDYERALSEARIADEADYNINPELIKPKFCMPCEGEGSIVTEDVIIDNLRKLKDWKLTKENRAIEKQYKFKTYNEALTFINLASELINEQNHHPEIYLNYNKLKLIFTTHALGGLTKNDFIMAEIIDGLSTCWF